MINPTPSELEVLNILWELQEANTQIVNDRLNLQPRLFSTYSRIRSQRQPAYKICKQYLWWLRE